MDEISYLQKHFFEQIKLKIADDVLPANEIASLLGLSKSEVYNKISGKSQLTLSQIYTLAKKYELRFSIDPSVERNNFSNLKYTPFHIGTIGVSDYLSSLNTFLEELINANVSKLSCATDDIPFFHMFQYPELTAFKLHFWNTRKAQAENQPGIVFDYKKANKKDIQSSYQLYKLYRGIPSLEIWTKSNLLISLDQLRFAYESQILKDKKLAYTICEQLLKTLDDVEGYAVAKSKSSEKEIVFDWYQCDVVGSVTYLAETPSQNFCFLRFNTFNNFQSDNTELNLEVKMWLQSLLNHSTGFSGHGSKQRNIYLNEVRLAINNLKDSF